LLNDVNDLLKDNNKALIASKPLLREANLYVSFVDQNRITYLNATIGLVSL